MTQIIKKSEINGWYVYKVLIKNKIINLCFRDDFEMDWINQCIEQYDT